jgi:hypothetical protein
MVYASPESAYIKKLAPFLAKKKRIAADEWGCDAKLVADIFQPLEDWLVKEVQFIYLEVDPFNYSSFSPSSRLPTF